MVLLILYLTLALGVSFLCSLLEAVLLSVPRAHVAAMAERSDRAGIRLERMKSDLDRPLAAILTLNTFAHTLGAAGVGAQAAALWGEMWVGAVSVVLTLAVLVFSEIIPKTIGAVHSRSLAPFAAWMIEALILVLRPFVAGCDWVTKLVAGRSKKALSMSRKEVGSIARLALEAGVIDKGESEVIRNLIALREIRVEEVMTPRPVVFTLRADQTVSEVTSGAPPRFTRIPVIGSSLDDAKGLIHRHDLSRAVGEGRADTTLGELARELHVVPEVARLPSVLSQFLQRREHLFLVVDEFGSSVGIVTLEDVLETLLGVPIVDETDTVEDMREHARRIVATRRTGVEREAGGDPDQSA